MIVLHIQLTICRSISFPFFQGKISAITKSDTPQRVCAPERAIYSGMHVCYNKRV